MELLSLQMFMGAALLSTLLLAAVMHEHWDALVEIRKQNRELSVIHRISEIASGSGAEEDIIGRIAEAIVSQTGFPYVAIELCDAARERLVLKGAKGFPVTGPEGDGAVVLGNPVSMEVARSGKAVVESRSGERVAHRRDLMERLGIRTLICVPMVLGGKVSGVLTLGHTDLVGMRERPPGWVQSLAGTIATLVERKRSVEGLRASEERFRAIADYTYGWENWVGPDGALLWVNPAVERVSGYSQAECMAMRGFPIPLIHPDDLQMVQHHLEAALLGSTGDNMECRIRRKDGSIRWVSASWQPIFDSEGRSQGHRSGIRDITERKEAEQELRRYRAELEDRVASRTKELQETNVRLTDEIRERIAAEVSLRESELRFRSMYNTALQGIAIFDPADGIILEANRKFHEMLGYGGNELSGRNWFRKVHREDGQAALAHARDATGGVKEVPIREYRFWRTGGAVLWGRVALSVISGNTGRPGLVVAMVDDVTDLHRYMDELLKYQEELRNLAAYLQTAREEERVRIAREIHDELGQMLTALKMDTVLLEGQVAGEVPAARAKLESMKSALDMTIGTVKRIVKELRPNLLDHFGLVAAIEVHLKEFAQRTGIECRALLRPDGAAVDRDLSISVFRVCQEALTNIARHARASRARVRLTEESGMLCLTIVDNGRGITRREVSDRSSLGLIGIRERVRPLGGDFRIRGIRGRGTALSVRIPVHSRAMVV
jgi:two-component system sensor histidine kinase UhpB